MNIHILKTRFIHNPIVRILLGGIFCIGLPILLNKTILWWLLDASGLSENLARSVRAIVTSIILMPAFYIIFYCRIEKRKISEFAIQFALKDILSGILTAILSILGLLVLIGIFSNVKIDFTGYNNAIIHHFILILCLVIMEEVFFRGIMYRIIQERWGINWALAVSGIIFGLTHISNPNMNIQSLIAIVVAGLLLGVMYSLKNRLWFPIAFHFGWNFSQVLLGVSLSGTENFVNGAMFKTSIVGNEIITGGNFGIENSVFAIGITGFLFFFLYKSKTKKRI